MSSYKRRRVTGPSATAMLELAARIQHLLRELLYAETNADARSAIMRATQSLYVWAKMYTPAKKEVSYGESATDQSSTVETGAVEAPCCGTPPKVD